MNTLDFNTLHFLKAECEYLKTHQIQDRDYQPVFNWLAERIENIEQREELA
jgi:hypothetical protein|tara:strand:- start:504 stop:656 length:153 start_codon:yes stop_codon:yes gene_type:complete